MGQKNSNLPNFSSKYHIEKEIDIIMNKLNIIKQNFQLFKLLKSEDNIEYICKQFPCTFSIILDSLEERALLELTKLVGDHNNNCITLNDIRTKYQFSKNIFKEKKYYYVKDASNGKRHRMHFDYRNIDTSMKKLNNDLEANKKLVEYLKNRRNKSFAHNDKKNVF